MSRSIESQLNESYRDTLVAYYLGEVVPNHPKFIELGLNERLKNANDLYELFLVDNQVSNDVQTSYVASAISSLQQYINGALLGMEPGYDQLRPDEARFVEWRDRSSQYPIWAANQQLALYPEIYISPELRMKKSGYFAQLENEINQNKIHIDTTQEAVKSYLASFEEVANLTVINGYIDSDRFAEGKYYFLGKSRAEQIYYWRMVDMNERAYQSGTEGPKDDNPTPGAWTDWKKAEIGVTANTLERTIRPVFFNNRLFITWVDLVHVVDNIELVPPTAPQATANEENSTAPGTEWPYWAREAPEPPVINKTPQVQLLFNMSYKKYDDSWSAPQIYMDVTTASTITRALTTVDLEQNLNTVAIFDTSASPESLFIAMYAGEKPGSNDTDGSTSTYAFLETAFIDKNFNSARAFPSAGYIDSTTPTAPESPRIKKTCWTFALKNKNNFQFTWGLYITLKPPVTSALNPDSPEWNYRNQQQKIANMATPYTPVIDHENSLLILSTAIRSNFNNSEEQLFTADITLTVLYDTWEFHLNARPFNNSYWVLDSESTLTVSSGLSFNSRIITSLLATEEDGAGNELGLLDFLRAADFDLFNIQVTAGTSSVINLASGYIKKRTIDILSGHSSINPADITGGIIQLKYSATHCAASFTVNASPQPLTFNQEFKYPTTMNTPGGDQVTYSYSSVNDSLTAPSVYKISLPFDKTTLLPKLIHTTFTPNSTKFYITHGVGMDSKSAGGNLGDAMKSTEIELEFLSTAGANPIAPKISKRTDPVLGIAEYIDFSGSTIENSDDPGNGKRKPIRMNTLFARELINKANIALEALLSWGTQQLPEPPIGDETEPTVMDFKGANGLYFWELFLHLPFMVSHRLNLEQQFSEAEFWLAFIFDPARKAHDSAPAYWNVRPLVEVSDPDYFMRAPIDPDGIAASDPVKYQKAVYFHYIKNLTDRGDMAYRQLTPDSLGEAKLWYVRILDLLGPRHDTALVSQWTPVTLGALASSTSQPLREFANRLEQQEQQMRSSAKANSGKALIRFKEAPLRLSTFGSDPTLAEEDNDAFIAPMNAELVKHWDTLESRLYNLRHNLSLDGKPLSLPLFAAPLDPRALLAAYANGANGGGAGSLLTQETPHYRYAVMFARASAAVDTLIQFGTTLLSIIERREQAELMELQQQQAWQFAQFAIDLQLETQKVEAKAREALMASKAIADARGAFYAELANENISTSEGIAAALFLGAEVAEGIAAVASATAAALKPIPNHAGTEVEAEAGMTVGIGAGVAIGGFRLEGIPEVTAITTLAIATGLRYTAGILDRTEQFRRRRQEWENARDQANLEAEQINAQLAVHDAQTRVTELQLRQAQEAKKHAEIQYAFLRKRFSNSQLYGWLTGQFSTFYYQAYDATFSLCMAAQACWQYEIADYTAGFIKPGAWKDAYRGLAAGESLKLNLLRMDAAYLTRNDRKLEITKTVSVRQLPASSDADPSINLPWEEVVTRLTEEGIAEFEITQAMLDADYPEHYLRRIKRISVSLPVTVGPYQDIRATLTQTWNATQMSAAADAPLKENMRASQQITVSTGVDDDGLFVFNFDDERYLPFEGTGAISRWSLQFPNPAAQQEIIDSITDIIIHVRYTAKSRGVTPGKRG